MDSITNIDGEVVENPDAKTWAIIALSLKIAKDEEMLNRIIKFCIKEGNQLSSFEDVLSNKTKFKNMLLRYPEISEEYQSRLRAERTEDVLKAKDLLQKTRKLRRRKK